MNLKILKVDCRDQEKYTIKMRRGHQYQAYQTPTKTKIYIFLEGENLIQNLQNRHSRPYTLYKKLLPQIMEQVKAQGIEVPENLKFVWSQKAGCKCGCSPGFLVNWIGKEIFVTIACEKENVEA